MSDQTGIAPAGAPPAVPVGGTTPPGTGGDPYKMHDHAMQAEKHLEALATEMGKADTDPQIIKAVSSMADGMRQIAKSMSRAPAPAPKRQTMASATNELAAAAQQPPA